MARRSQEPHIVIDPEFEALIPPMTDEEYKQLKKNIYLSCEVRDPIVLWCDSSQWIDVPSDERKEWWEYDHVIIDGHNRWKIIQELKAAGERVLYKYDIQSFLETRDEVKAWMIQNQLGRRNITPFARTELALKLKPLLAKQAKDNQGTRTDILPNSAKSEEPKNTRQAIAKMAGVSGDTVAKVEKIVESAPEEMKTDLRVGKISINKAYNKIGNKKEFENKLAIIVKDLHDIEKKRNYDMEDFSRDLETAKDMFVNSVGFVLSEHQSLADSERGKKIVEQIIVETLREINEKRKSREE